MSLPITNGEIVAAVRAINKLLQMKMRPAAAIKVARLAKEIQGQAELIAGVRSEILERHVQRDAAGKPVPGKDGNGQDVPGHVRVADESAFNAEVDELFKATVVLNCAALTMDDLRDDLEPMVILDLGPLLQVAELAK